MRSRTEMVTTTLEGSEFEDESDLEDSEDDWKPSSKKKPRSLLKPVKVKKGKPAAKKRGRQPQAKKKPAKGRKRKTSTSEEDDDDLTDDEMFYSENSSSDEEYRVKTSNSRSKPIQATPPPPQPPPKSKKSENGSGKVQSIDENLSVLKPLSRKSPNVKLTPNRSNGQFELLICKSVLKDGVKDNPNICLWRRDGSSLLQKYVPDNDDKATEIFKASSVYTSWEEDKKKNYCEIRVQNVGDSQSGKIKILDLDELEKLAASMGSEDGDDDDDGENSNGECDNEEEGEDEEGVEEKDDEDDDDDEDEEDV